MSAVKCHCLLVLERLPGNMYNLIFEQQGYKSSQLVLSVESFSYQQIKIEIIRYIKQRNTFILIQKVKSRILQRWKTRWKAKTNSFI